jgi:hypothetical protein
MAAHEWDIFKRIESLEGIAKDFRDMAVSGDVPWKGTTELAANAAMLAFLSCTWSLQTTLMQCENAEDAKDVFESSMDSFRALKFDKEVMSKMESSFLDVYNIIWKNK